MVNLRFDVLSLLNGLEGSTHNHGDCSQEENDVE